MNWKAVAMTVASRMLGLMAGQSPGATPGMTSLETRLILQRALASLATALTLALVCGTMIGALLLGAHYILYYTLVTYTTLTPLAALCITFAVGVVATTVLALVAKAELRRIAKMPRDVGAEVRNEVRRLRARPYNQNSSLASTVASTLRQEAEQALSPILGTLQDVAHTPLEVGKNIGHRLGGLLDAFRDGWASGRASNLTTRQQRLGTGRASRKEADLADNKPQGPVGSPYDNNYLH